MKKRIFLFIIYSFLVASFLVVLIVFEINSLPIGSSLAGIAIGLLAPITFTQVQDLTDCDDWMISQRKLIRGHLITKDTIIRISFAYLFRIKVMNKYLLVFNSRNTGKYQPVGGVYKFEDEEKLVLKNSYHVMDDDKIPIDESSKNDYRLRIKNKYLRKFVKWFNSGAKRENVENLSREFKEELVDIGVLNWNQISYRLCGRHITSLNYSKHFQTYELLLADIVELIPTKEQERDLLRLLSSNSDQFLFSTYDEIVSLGIKSSDNDLQEIIADHTAKILEENEDKLIKTRNYGTVFTVDISK